MKVAFYLPNKFCYADCSNVDLGNPGIGWYRIHDNCFGLSFVYLSEET